MKTLPITTSLIALLICAPIHAEDIHFFDYSFGVSYQYLSIKDIPTIQSNQERISGGNGHAIGLYYKGEPFEYMQFTTGIDYMMVDDATPFNQTVENEFTGDVSVRKSDVSGFGMYAEAGLLYTPNQLEIVSFGLLGGYRYNNIERGILRCENCDSEELKDFDSSLYGKAFVEFQLTTDVHIQLNYTHFMADTGFDNSVGIQVSFSSF